MHDTPANFAFREVYSEGLNPDAGPWRGTAEGRMNTVRPFGYEADSSAVVGLRVGQASKKQQFLSRLDEFENLQYLEVLPYIDQRFFDAICGLPKLEYLVVGGARIENVEAVAKASKLSHFKLERATGVASFSPLGRCPNLRCLTLSGNFKLIHGLGDIGGLRGLIGLEIFGPASGRQSYSSLKPLSGLTSLRYLGLSGVRIEDGSLAPLAALSQLEYLLLGDWSQWIRADYRLLHASLKRLRSSDTVRNAATNDEFCRANRIG